MRRVDLHVHTICSKDAVNRQSHLQAALRRLDAIAICDHNQIICALKLRARLGYRIIVGMEIDTGEGELIGLFLKEPIPSGLGLERTAEEIRAQGGLVIAPHPFDLRRKGAGTGLSRIVHLLDAVEVFNARTMSTRANAEALQFAVSRGLACVAGSDAHVPTEIGLAVTSLKEVPLDAEHARVLLKKASFSGRAINLFERVYARVRRSLRL
ncbi:MAG: phosphoesterase [Planctomycetota bacterium]|nr:MAG: phosphoesterase [Planctomycetota bacterium]